MIRVVLLASTKSLNRHLVQLLSDNPELDLVTNTAANQSPYDFVAATVPDVALVLFDNHNHKQQLRLISYIRSRSPRTQIIVVVPDNHIETVYTALSHGAIGYIFAPHPESEFSQPYIIKAIQTADRRGGILTPQLARFLVKKLGFLYILLKLSPRERTILYAYAGNNAERRVSSLALSDDTIQRAIGCLFNKIALSRSPERISFAKRQSAKLRKVTIYALGIIR